MERMVLGEGDRLVEGIEIRDGSREGRRFWEDARERRECINGV